MSNEGDSTSIVLRKAKLDEIELYLEFLKTTPELLKDKPYKEIAKLIRERYKVYCSEQQIYLLYEPTIEDDIIDSEIFYKEVLGL